MTTENQRRHSVAEDVEIIIDPTRRAEAEARNGLRQFDLGMRVVEDALLKGDLFRLRLSTILGLHREALVGISHLAGQTRPASVIIHGSKHQPVDAYRVNELLEDMCDYVNERWLTATPIHLSAYTMWRLNWIHPFADGNGRTSRIVSYVVLCIALRTILPGTNSIPDQIVANRQPYFEALEAADAVTLDGKVDLSQMEALIEQRLAVQLADLFNRAGGRDSKA